MRRQLHEVCTTGAGPLMTSPPMLGTLEAATPIGQAAMDAARDGVPPDSPAMPDTPQFRIETAGTRVGS